MKGRSSRKLQQEFPDLKKKSLDRHFWAIGYGCWSKGNITDSMVNEYLERHRNQLKTMVQISFSSKIMGEFQSPLIKLQTFSP